MEKKRKIRTKWKMVVAVVLVNIMNIRLIVTTFQTY